MNKEEIKYYISSDGKKTPLNEVHTEHLINGLSKRYREVFSSVNKDDFVKRTNEINDMKEELYKRFNSFHDTLGD